MYESEIGPMKNAIVALVDAGIRSEKHLRRMCPGVKPRLFYTAVSSLMGDGKLSKDALGYYHTQAAPSAGSYAAAGTASVRVNYAPHSLSALLMADTLRRSGWNTKYYPSPEKMRAERSTLSGDVRVHVTVVNARHPDHATSYDRLIVRAMFNNSRIPPEKREAYVLKIRDSLQKIAERTQLLETHAHCIAGADGTGNVQHGCEAPLERIIGPKTKGRQERYDASMSYLKKRAAEISEEQYNRRQMLELYSV